MILNGVNSDQYIYLRLTSDLEYPYSGRRLSKGTIIRFSVAELRNLILNIDVRNKLFALNTILHDAKLTRQYFYLNVERKKDVLPSAFLPQDLYSRFIIEEDLDFFIEINPNDLICINEWLKSKLNSEKFSSEAFFRDNAKNVKAFNQTFFKNGKFASFTTKGNELIPLNPSGVFEYLGKLNSYSHDRPFDEGNVICTSAGDVICLPLLKGDILDLSDPAINLLLLDQKYIRFLLQTEIVPEEVKAILFKRDFEGWVPEANRRYFRLHDSIKVKDLSMKEIHKIWSVIEQCAPDFYNYFTNNYWRYSSEDQFDYDSEGFLRYIHTSDEFLEEEELAKIADRVSVDVGRLHYEHEVLAREKNEREKELKWKAKDYLKAHKGRFYKLQKKNPNLTPVQFMQMEEERIEEQKRVLVRRLHISLKKRIKDLESK